MRRIREIMSESVVALGQEMTLAKAASVLEKHHISGAPVLYAGHVVGVLSRVDLYRAAQARAAGAAPRLPDRNDEASRRSGLDLPADHAFGPGSFRLPPSVARGRPTLVRDVMTRRIVAIRPDADVSEAAALMECEGVHRVLAMEGDALFGIVSAHDIVRAVAADAPSIRRVLAPSKATPRAPEPRFPT